MKNSFKCKTLHEFHYSREFFTTNEARNIPKEFNAPYVLSYGHPIYIYLTGNSMYTKTKDLETIRWENNDLYAFEKSLWDKHIKKDFLTKEEILNDLHIRAKELLDEMRLDISLDEVYTLILNDKYRIKVEYLRNEFKKHS